jgi:hypothetical protein
MRIFIICTLHKTVLRVIKSRTRWAGHISHTEKMGNAYKILVEKFEGGDVRWKDNAKK